YSSKAIAEKLFVAPGTVQSHTKRIYAKLGVHAKQELIELVNREEGDG
ncbi:helix-turn-helix transcriptional regulator, partial [Adlercreutzia equolifaciens]